MSQLTETEAATRTWPVILYETLLLQSRNKVWESPERVVKILLRLVFYYCTCHTRAY